MLLKNDGILPLANVKTIAMIGPYARTTQILGGGSSSVTPHYTVSPFDGVNNPEGKDVLVEAAAGSFIYKNLPAPAPETLSTPDGKSGLRLSLFAGTEFAGEPLYVQTTTRVQHGWFDRSVPKVPQDNFSMRMEGLFTPQESGLHTLSLSAMGWARLFLNGELVVDHWADSDMGKEKTTVIGVIPEALIGKEVAGRVVDHRGLTRLEVVDSMHTRMARMAELADGFVALPGGFGTFEEFCEVLTWGQLGFHVKLMGLLNVNGFYDPLLALFEHAVAEGFLPEENRAMALAADDIESLLAALAAYRPEPVSKWLKDAQQL